MLTKDIMVTLQSALPKVYNRLYQLLRHNDANLTTYNLTSI